MNLHPEIPLVALLGLVHLRIPLSLFVFGGAGRGDQGGVNDRALAHRHAPSSQECLDGVKDLLAQPMLLQQVPEGEDRGLIGDPVADQLDAGKTRIVGTSIRASSIAGSLSEYHCCSRWMRSMVASG